MEAITPTRTVDQAAERLRAALLDGVWRAGEHLPGERGLAEELGISRLTLRAALARLEAEGLVKARQGSGIEVLDFRANGGVELIGHLVAHGELELLGPFLELRRAVAAEAVALAADRATDAELDALQALADRLAITPDRDELMAGNLAFAAQVVDLADNVPMRLLFNTVARVLGARPDVLHALVADEPAVRASYGLFVALLRERSPERARTAVRHALEAIDAHTLCRLETR